MAKRGADKPLNYDNWDEPDVPLDAGVFEKADEATIKSRNIIVPRRKSTPLATQAKRGLFKSFEDFRGGSIPALPVQPISSPQPEIKDEACLSKLALLNKEVSAWISKHVSEDPYCILTPIFEDYSNYLASIELPKKESSIPKSIRNNTNNVVPTSLATLKNPAPDLQSPAANGFIFKFQPSSSSESPITSKPPVFSFGLAASNCTLNASTGPVKFSFTPSPKTSETPAVTSNAVEDEEYVPPKPEVKEIKEDGSVFSMRCKLFYKKSDQWTERGLGNLHIIPSSEDKFQLLIRADTNLGNILLNIMVTKDIPMQIQKNNITFACVPSPPLPGVAVADASDSTQRPVPMLVRVKTEAAAENLLSEIDKHRGKKKQLTVNGVLCTLQPS